MGRPAGIKRGPYKSYKKTETIIPWCELPPCRDNVTMERIKKAALEHALYGPRTTKKRVPKIPLTEEQKRINHNSSNRKSYHKLSNIDVTGTDFNNGRGRSANRRGTTGRDGGVGVGVGVAVAGATGRDASRGESSVSKRRTVTQRSTPPKKKAKSCSSAATTGSMASASFFNEEGRRRRSNRGTFSSLIVTRRSCDPPINRSQLAVANNNPLLYFALDHTSEKYLTMINRYVSSNRPTGNDYLLSNSQRLGLIASAKSAKQVIRRFVRDYCGYSFQESIQMHHVGKPEMKGLFAEFDTKIVNEDNCPLLKGTYIHDNQSVLIGTSEGRGVELLYIPSIFHKKSFWQKALTPLEHRLMKRLFTASTSVDSLLQFRLDKNYTILESCIALHKIPNIYHHNNPHLRFSTQSMGQCAKCHRFTEKRYKTRDKKTKEVIECGSILLCLSQNEKRPVVKAYYSIVIPLMKITEHYLRHLPPHLFPRINQWIKTYFDNECSYISLNVYWHPSAHKDLPNSYWRRKGKVWKKFPMEQDTNSGQYLHEDYNNWGFGAVLVFGAGYVGFDQRYVTMALQLPCPGWSIVFGNYRDLLHSVTPGKNGIRFSLVVTNHESCVLGKDKVGRDVYY